MFVLGDESHYHGRSPWVTYSLIGVHAAVFLLQLALGEPFTNGFSLVPAEIAQFRDLTQTQFEKVRVPLGRNVDRQGRAEVLFAFERVPIRHYPGPFPIVLTLFTAMFLHGGVGHLVGNMWFLYLFGRNVECALDHGRYLALYVLCGIAGGLAHVASAPQSVLPCLGASGAISGVMGAYLAIHPFNKIRIWFGLYLGVIQLPALAVIGVWFLLQYLAAFREHADPIAVSNIAYFAHIGGFVAGYAGIWCVALYLKWQLAQISAEGIGAEPPVLATEEHGICAGRPDPLARCVPSLEEASDPDLDISIRSRRPSSA